MDAQWNTELFKLQGSIQAKASLSILINRLTQRFLSGTHGCSGTLWCVVQKLSSGHTYIRGSIQAQASIMTLTGDQCGGVPMMTKKMRAACMLLLTPLRISCSHWSCQTPCWTHDIDVCMSMCGRVYAKTPRGNHSTDALTLVDMANALTLMDMATALTLVGMRQLRVLRSLP
eukprot:1136313-Pelagomonas_calceolata.AAC.2